MMIYLKYILSTCAIKALKDISRRSASVRHCSYIVSSTLLDIVTRCTGVGLRPAPGRLPPHVILSVLSAIFYSLLKEGLSKEIIVQLVVFIDAFHISG